MITSRDSSVTFTKPFRLNAIDRLLPAGTYRLVIDEERTEQASFSVTRRLTTMLYVTQRSKIEMWTVEADDLAAAQKLDADALGELS
jgi:hypothetical protein